MTLLENDVAPVWVWVIVIVLGSIFVVLSLSLLFWCVHRRNQRRHHPSVDVEGGHGTEKKLSLSHGKVVPKRSYMSLTGSRYGSSHGEQEHMMHLPATHRPVDAERPAVANEQPLTQPPNSHLNEFTSDTRDNVGTESVLSQSTEYRSTRPTSNSTNHKSSHSMASSISELSATSKPLLAKSPERSPSNAVNFSRPQQRRAPTVGATNRLSIIRESTPSSWYSRISRILSMASSDRESDHMEPLPERPEMYRIPDRAPRVSLTMNQPYQSNVPEREPLDEALEHIQRLSQPESPEPTPRHLSHATYGSDDQTILAHSRTSSVATQFPRRQDVNHKHTFSTASTNFSRKPTYSSHSRDSSVNGLLRKPQGVEHEQNTEHVPSWAEPPQATLSGPFDSPVLDGMRESGVSLWSYETYHSPTSPSQRYTGTTMSPGMRSIGESTAANTPALHQDDQMPQQVIASPRSDLNEPIHTVPLSVAQENAVANEEHQQRTWYEDSPSTKERGRLSEKKRGRYPVRVRSKSGRNVLRKKSAHKSKPEIRLIGAVDPSSLENLSIAD